MTTAAPTSEPEVGRGAGWAGACAGHPARLVVSDMVALDICYPP